ncbi:hypothetical protein FRB94_002555 [Tulasnella sp. JGI-2019a]|nr:hypothetical protein FRB94_002555 [Tulasnella sp. JGI-2019a]
MPLDVNSYDLAPSGLKLEQVHIYIRHGERTPVSVRLNNSPASVPEFWNMCKTARKFMAAVYPHNILEVRRVSERASGKSVDGECMLGELTDLGRESTYKFGLALRELYKDRLGFLPDIVTSDGTAYFRSTNMPRTIESLQQVIHGLYPRRKFADGVVPRVRVRHGKDENLVTNSGSCGRLRELQVEFAEAAAREHNPGLAKLDHKLAQFNDDRPIRVDSKPRLSGVLDTVHAAHAHGVAVPSEFLAPDVHPVLESAVVAEWFGGYKTKDFRKLAMGRLLDDLQSKMHRKAALSIRDPLKIAINSCHDTSLAGIMSTLDVFDNRWPAFTASITFELHSQPKSLISSIFSGSDHSHYVRMRYKNKNLVLPACSAPEDHLSDHPEFCTLEAFRRVVRTVTPDDWEAECSMKPPRT